MRRNQSEIEFKVGLFVGIGVLLIMAMIVLIGGIDKFVTKHHKYYTHFDDVSGLISGSKVLLSGLRVGSVDNVTYEKSDNRVRVDISVSSKYSEMVRVDSIAEVATQGILGDKYVAINGGTPQEGALPPGSEIKTTTGKGISQFLTKSDVLVGNLNSITQTLDRILKTFESNRRAETMFAGLAATAKNLASATEKVNRDLDHLQLKEISSNLKGILSKINDGTGTLGALVNDPDLYYDLRALMGGVNRNRIMRNLVRKTVQDAQSGDAAPTPKPSGVNR